MHSHVGKIWKSFPSYIYVYIFSLPFSDALFVCKAKWINQLMQVSSH